MKAGTASALTRLAGLLLLCTLAGCGNSPAQRLAKAQALLDSKDRPAALVQVKSVIQDHPELPAARLLLGRLLLEGGDPAAAEIELQRALALGQPDAEVVPQLARVLLASGQATKLLLQYRTLAWPDAQATATLKTLLAEAEASLGDLQAAQDQLGQALQLAPGYEPALRLRARVAAVAGDLPGALRQIDALLASHPGSADAWLLKGDVLARQGAAAADVVAAYRQALQVQPEHAGAHGALVGLRLASQDLPAATTQWQAMQKLLPRHPQTLLYEGQLALAKGDLPRARELFQLLLRAAPDNLLLLRLAAAVELRLGAPAQAELLLAKALQTAPDSATGRRLLAQSQLAQGQAAKALATLEPLIGQRPDAEALTLAAQARLLAGQGDAAAALFERAARLQPADPKIRTTLAMARLARGGAGGGGAGGDDAALAELQAVASSDAGSSADLALVAAHLRRKAYGPALQAIDALARKQPDRPMPAQLRAQVLLLQGDQAGARQAYAQALQHDARYFPAVAGLAALELQAGQPQAAQARFEALLKHDPQNAQAYQALAELDARAGAGRDQVAARLAQAVKANPVAPGPRLALIDHHLATANPKAALAAVQAALALQPERPELLARLGQAQRAAGETQQALATYGRLVALQAQLPASHLGLAETQIDAKDWTGAGRSVRRALELAPDLLAAQRLAIRIALRQQQPEAALLVARQVQKQRPAQAVGWMLEGEVLLARGQAALAVPVLRQAISKAQPGEAPERLHTALQRSGQPAEADALAQRWLRAHPGDALFLFYLGDQALAQKDLAGAEQRYQAVLQIKPEHGLALNNIAWLKLQQQQAGALAYAQRAVRASPDQPPLMDTLALALAADKQTGQAIQWQKRALEMRPDDPYLRFNLARFYAQAGEKRLAKAELDRLAALGERFPRQDEVAALTLSLGGR